MRGGSLGGLRSGAGRARRAAAHRRKQPLVDAALAPRDVKVVLVRQRCARGRRHARAAGGQPCRLTCLLSRSRAAARGAQAGMHAWFAGVQDHALLCSSNWGRDLHPVHAVTPLPLGAHCKSRASRSWWPPTGAPGAQTGRPGAAAAETPRTALRSRRTWPDGVRPGLAHLLPCESMQYDAIRRRLVSNVLQVRA
jgi:hypothetical protein